MGFLKVRIPDFVWNEVYKSFGLQDLCLDLQISLNPKPKSIWELRVCHCHFGFWIIQFSEARRSVPQLSVSPKPYTDLGFSVFGSSFHEPPSAL